MARDDKTRLFRPEDLLSRDELAADAEGARSPAAVERDEDLDAAHMWISKDDGLLVRGVKPHSAQKSTLVSRGIDTVSSAMSGKWFAVKHGVQYLELYTGPGRLLDESTGVEQAGSPIRALSVRKPFTHYVLSDFSQGCVDALSARVGERTDVDIVRGDANDPGHLERVAGLLNSRALIVAYLDPARPQDLRWTTVEYLATKFGFIDLIINLPLNSLMRAILGAYRAGGRGLGAAGRFLNHARPHDLLLPSVDRPNTAATIGAIRRHYDEQLMALGSSNRHGGASTFPRTTRTTTSCSSRGTSAVSTCGTRRTLCQSIRSCRFSWATNATRPTSPTDHRLSSSRKSVALFRGIGLMVGMSHVLSPAVSTSHTIARVITPGRLSLWPPGGRRVSRRDG